MAEQLAQPGDVDGEVAFLDHPPGPDELHQLVLRDDTVAPLD
jgi:hypothetical protein